MSCCFEAVMRDSAFVIGKGKAAHLLLPITNHPSRMTTEP